MSISSVELGAFVDEVGLIKEAVSPQWIAQRTLSGARKLVKKVGPEAASKRLSALKHKAFGHKELQKTVARARGAESPLTAPAVGKRIAQYNSLDELADAATHGVL